MATMDVKDAAGSTVAIEKPLAPGRAAAAASRPVVLSTEDLAALSALATETTLNAVGSVLSSILVKIIAAPATEAKQDALAALVGEVQASPTANTVLDRLKAIAAALSAATPAGSNLIGSVGIDQTTPGTTNAVAPIAGQSGVAAGAGAVGATTQRVTLASDDPAVTRLGEVQASPTANTVLDRLKTIAANVQGLVDMGAGDYETVAASQTDQVLGATGAAGDYLAGVLIVPASTSPGAVSIKDGAGSSITLFPGGASSVTGLVPFFVPLGIKAATAWKVTTGANVSAIGVGNFT